MDYEDILYSVVGGVATITLNRPSKLNALGMRTYEELRHALRASSADEAAGVVVLKGAGRAFCAGGDIDMAQTMLTSEHAGRTQFFDRMIPVTDAILSMAKPVICAIQGACVGGGAELSIFADFVVADETAFFAFNGTAIGGCSWWGAPQMLPVLVGMRKAEELLYLSQRVEAREAARIGLINRVVAEGELDASTHQLCQEVLDLSEDGLRLTKAALRQTKEVLLSSMRASAEMNVAALGKSDLRDAFAALGEGRAVSWRALRPGLAHTEAS